MPSSSKNLPGRQAILPASSHRLGPWALGAVATAVALWGTLASFDAQALVLGRLTVQSALGEPLKAEIDISDISAEEAASLQAGIASPESFKSAGLEYTPLLTGISVSLKRRPNGTAYFSVLGNRAVTEPFVDLILEANWASGRMSRDYTLLFDPPNLRAAPSSTAITSPALVSPTAKASSAVKPTVDSVSTPVLTESPASSRESVPAKPVKAGPSEKPAADKLRVKAGDTAGKIAAQNKAAHISLDQMLVALLRANPDAFIGGNINRLRSGVVLDVPSAQATATVSAVEASQTVLAQSKDFNNFRRHLAEKAPAQVLADADRQAGGSVQAKVEDRAPASTPPDKLTLSKGAVQAKAAVAEEKIAKERQAKDAAARVAELSKNISELNKLTKVPAAAGVSAPAASASTARNAVPGVAIPVPPPVAVAASAPGNTASAKPALTTTSAPSNAASAKPALVTTSAPSIVAVPLAAASVPITPAVVASAAASSPAASDPALASLPVASASQAASRPAPVSKPAPKPAAQPAPEPSFLDELLDNPWALPGAGGFVVLLAALGFYRYRQRKSASHVDSSFLESRLQPDSFFGASGGQRIDTNESSNVSGSSMVYSPSQLDAAGDVDPVAEAEVYWAYGRDLQAEEILKEAMRSNPMRVAIHAKLLEIYAKRNETKAFEELAKEAFRLTQGKGPEWTHIADLGRVLDASNALYQLGGYPKSDGDSSALVTTANSAVSAKPVVAVTKAPAPAAPLAPLPPDSVDFDLDVGLDSTVDLPLDEPASFAPPPVVAPPTAPSKAKPTVPEPTKAVSNFGFSADDLNFDAEPLVPTRPVLVNPAVSVPAAAPKAVTAFASPVPAAPAPVLPADPGMLEFDLGSLSLDLAPAAESEQFAPAVRSAGPGASSSDDPLETKLQLAQEFHALGDAHGARALAEEVSGQASGPLKAKALAFLQSL